MCPAPFFDVLVYLLESRCGHLVGTRAPKNWTVFRLLCNVALKKLDTWRRNETDALRTANSLNSVCLLAAHHRCHIIPIVEAPPPPFDLGRGRDS